MKTMVNRSAFFASAFLICVCADTALAQYQPGVASEANPKPTLQAQQQQTPKTASAASVQSHATGATTNAARNSNTNGFQKDPAAKPAPPWKLTSRIHLEKGTNKGYLVVQLDLAEGYHIYSLDPQGSPSPTKLAVLPSSDLKVQSKFTSDKPPKVTEKDPVFQQRIEKHSGQIQFFASIVVRPGINLKKLEQEITFSGQVCSDSACQPIRNHVADAKFAGYFEVPKTRSARGTQQLK